MKRPSMPPETSCCNRRHGDTCLKHHLARRASARHLGAGRPGHPTSAAITPTPGLSTPVSGYPSPRCSPFRADRPASRTIGEPPVERGTTNDHTPVLVKRTGSPPGGLDQAQVRRPGSARSGDVVTPGPNAGTPCFAHGNSLLVRVDHDRNGCGLVYGTGGLAPDVPKE